MNTIRTPKTGTNATSKRIAEAVDDEEWQKFRVSLKGVSTFAKLSMLLAYFEDEMQAIDKRVASGYDYTDAEMDHDREDIRIRVDNYLKALSRGGQIAPAVNYLSDLVGGKLVIRK